MVSVLLCSASALAASSNQYRLAGVVAAGEDYLGFLELPEGGQLLVRPGSALPGGGRVTAVSRDRIKIVFPGRVIELSLEGSGQPGAPAMVRGVQQGQTDYDNVMVREVDNRRLRKALAAASPPASRRTGAQPSGAAEAAADVGRRFSSVINIPPNARVVAVNEVPVTSADKAMALVDRALAEGISLRLTMTGAGGDPETRVYLTPAAQ